MPFPQAASNPPIARVFQLAGDYGMFLQMPRRTPLLASLGAVLLALAGAPPPVAAQPQPPAARPAPMVPQAPEPPLKVTLSADGETLYLVGMFLDGAFHQVKAALDKAPRVKRVHLSSSGGFTLEGRLVSALVRKRRLDTYVEYYCASACTQIFAAGQQRVIGPLARLGFHQAVMVDENGNTAGVRPPTDRKLDSTQVFGVNGNDTLRLAYEMAGADPAFIDKALGFDHQNMWLPDQEQLLASHLVSRVAETSELPAPPGAITRDAVRATLLQQPLWRAAMTRLPGPTEMAVGDIWRSANSGYSLAEATRIGRAALIVQAAELLPTASEALLDRALAAYVLAARNQRARGYPGCFPETLGAPAEDPEETRFTAQEDAVMTDLLLSPEQAKALKPAVAERYFNREVSPLLSHSASLTDRMDSGQLCRFGFETFEAIDSLPAGKRLKAYRALLSLSALP